MSVPHCLGEEPLVMRWDDIDPLRRLGADPGTSGAGWSPAVRNLTDLDALLERHALDEEGFCVNGCHYGGVMYRGGCPTWAYAYREKQKLLLERRAGANDY